MQDGSQSQKMHTLDEFSVPQNPIFLMNGHLSVICGNMLACTHAADLLPDNVPHLLACLMLLPVLMYDMIPQP